MSERQHCLCRKRVVQSAWFLPFSLAWPIAGMCVQQLMQRPLSCTSSRAAHTISWWRARNLKALHDAHVSPQPTLGQCDMTRRRARSTPPHTRLRSCPGHRSSESQRATWSASRDMNSALGRAAHRGACQKASGDTRKQPLCKQQLRQYTRRGRFSWAKDLDMLGMNAASARHGGNAGTHNKCRFAFKRVRAETRSSWSLLATARYTLAPLAMRTSRLTKTLRVKLNT